MRVFGLLEGVGVQKVGRLHLGQAGERLLKQRLEFSETELFIGLRLFGFQG